MKFIYGVLTGLMLLGCVPTACFGQDGTDINQAIPIYFGQTVHDTVDKTTRPFQVYSIAATNGQQLIITGVASDTFWGLYLYNSSARTVVSNSSYVAAASSFANPGKGLSFSYLVATSGIYYVLVEAHQTGLAFQLQVTTQGTPIVPANPAQSGCVTGQVDNITYSLQLIAAGLPDTVSIGGTQLCSTCTVKPPAYPLLVSKLETAMALNVGVSACYDSSGNIFQLKLNHP